MKRSFLQFALVSLCSLTMCLNWPAVRSDEKTTLNSCGGTYRDNTVALAQFHLRVNCFFDLATVSFMEDYLRNLPETDDKKDDELMKKIVDLDKLKTDFDNKDCPRILGQECFQAAQEAFQVIPENRHSMSGIPLPESPNISYTSQLGSLVINELEELSTATNVTTSPDDLEDRETKILFAAIQNFNELEQNFPLHVELQRIIKRLESIRNSFAVMHANAAQLEKSLPNRSAAGGS